MKLGNEQPAQADRHTPPEKKNPMAATVIQLRESES